MSYLYLKENIIRQIKAKGFIIVSEGLYRKLVLL